MKKAVKWFERGGPPTGWRKSQKAEDRRRLLYHATDRRLSRHNRLVQAGRKAMALANVIRDSKTARKARADAEHFFALARRT